MLMPGRVGVVEFLHSSDMAPVGPIEARACVRVDPERLLHKVVKQCSEAQEHGLQRQNHRVRQRWAASDAGPPLRFSFFHKINNGWFQRFACV